ncbi:MAG TPA: DUF2344 domain-containing protein [Anaerolineae bacterium]|nr:DUF2344 domain-containing protein [Anaerolineae bacterium]
MVDPSWVADHLRTEPGGGLTEATAKRQRLRVTYRVDGSLRYVSNLERMRLWERTIRRARLPLSYSGGFNPRPRLQIGAALPVGFGADAEWMDIWLVEPMPPRSVRDALAQAAPEGLGVLRVEEVDLEEPALPRQIQAAEYEVVVETDWPVGEVRRRVAELLAVESLPRQRRGRAYDLRPLLHRLWVEAEQPRGVVVGMVLAAREGATGRPEEVLDALGLAGGFYRIRRRRLFLDFGS